MQHLRYRASLFFRLETTGFSISDECKVKCRRFDCRKCQREIHLTIWNQEDQIEDIVDCDKCIICVCIRPNSTTMTYLDPMSITKLLFLLQTENLATNIVDIKIQKFVNKLGDKLLECIRNAVYFSDKQYITASNCLLFTNYENLYNDYHDMIRGHTCCIQMENALNKQFEKLSEFYLQHKDILEKTDYAELPSKHKCSNSKRKYDDCDDLKKNPGDIILEKFGSLSCSSQRCLLAKSIPPDFELVATLSYNGVLKVIGSFYEDIQSDFSKLDEDKDIIWMYIKQFIDDKHIELRVSDITQVIACIQCKKQLGLIPSEGHYYGLDKLQCSAKNFASFYWRCCSPECNSKFRKQFQ